MDRKTEINVDCIIDKLLTTRATKMPKQINLLDS
jgi:hypothetical protein